MSDAATPRDDRAWPRWAGPFSVVAVVAALVATAWAIGSAGDADSRVPPLLVASGFVVLLVLSLLLFRSSFAALVDEGRPRGQLRQLGLVLVALAAFPVDPRLGTACMGGIFAAMFATNLWALRRARGNRSAVDVAEAAEEESRARDGAPAEERVRRDERPALDVRGALDAAGRGALQRGLAWLVAGAAATATVQLTGPAAARILVPVLSAAAVVWVGRALWSTWLARRDFEAARTPAERAWVALLQDPAPRMIRPLLGVWADEPVTRSGSFPRPDLVFRCDDDLDDLLSHQGNLVVHEAWVDTSSRGFRGTRWVAADEGLVLPHRRALFGRWYFGSITRAERPDPPAPLRTARPEPGAPRDPSADHAGGDHGRFVTLLAWRLAGLGALSVLLTLID